MSYQYYQEWGLVDGSADLGLWLVGLVLFGVIIGISEFLLNRQWFRVHLVFMALIALTVIGLGYALDSLTVWIPDVLLVLCLWDHYWARNRLGQNPVPLKKAKRIQAVAAVFLGICGVMVLGIGFFRGWNGCNLGVALLVSAGYVALHGFFHRNDTEARQFDRLP